LNCQIGVDKSNAESRVLLSVSTKLIGVVIFVGPQGHILLCENSMGKNQVGVHSMDNTHKAHQFKQIRGLMSGIPVCLMCVLKMFDDFWKKNESEVK